MRRRGFLKRLAGVATAAVVSERVIPDDGVSLFSAKHPTLLHDAAHHDLTGFGLAQAKPEGATIPYDLCEESLEAACVEIRRLGAPTQADLANMRIFGLDPDNTDHLVAYLTEKLEVKRLSKDRYEEFYGDDA